MRRWGLVIGALAASVLALLLAVRSIEVRTDMLAFLPAGQTEASRLVLEEARSGAATGLVLMGLEGAPAPELARVARAMAEALGKPGPGAGLFEVVAGGAGAVPAELFAHRYALVDTALDEAALRAGMEGVLRQMRGSAAPLAVQFGLRDPTGAFPALLQGWMPASAVRVVDGAWFAPDAGDGADRALLLARTKAGGMDIPAQEAALAAIDRAFVEAAPGGARLLVSGPAVFARDAARSIKGDVERISVLSTVLVAALLWWRFRSPLVLAAVATPVVLGVAVAALVVQAVFGQVHGVALGFGATMLGVSVDYPVLMIGHRKRGEAACATRARIGRAFCLAVLAALLGLGAMIGSGMPGLVQLGVFAAVGLGASAALTWAGLPWLVVRADLAPVAAGEAGWVRRVEGWRRHRWAAVALAAAALAYLVVHGARWEGDLQALSPVPAESLALDRAMRAQLGAPDAGLVAVVRGATAEEVLVRQEALLPALERLRAEGALSGAELAARLLPSAAVQRARLAGLPDGAVLRARVEAARAGLPFRAGAFEGFLEDVGQAAPLRPEDLAGTVLGARIGPLLQRRGEGWAGPVVLQGVVDKTRVVAALAGGALLVDVRAELGGVLAAATSRVWAWLGGSAAAVLAVLALGLSRAGWRAGLGDAARVVSAVAAALMVTVAALTLGGVRLSLIHLVALQLVAGVGLDYALFFARRQLDLEERSRTLRTLVTCNGMTLLTFGLLATCQTPVLRDIGVTVAVGAVLAMGFASLLAGRPAAIEDEEFGR